MCSDDNEVTGTVSLVFFNVEATNVADVALFLQVPASFASIASLTYFNIRECLEPRILQSVHKQTSEKAPRSHSVLFSAVAMVLNL